MLICQVTDLHLCAPDCLAQGEIDTNAMADRALSKIADLTPSPQALLVTGDVADRGLRAEYGTFRGLLGRHIRAPVYVIPGNHDKREPFRQALGELPGLDGASKFIQYVVETLPVRLVMLDTHVPGENYGELCADRLAFLDLALGAEPNRPTMVAMHHPPIASGIGFMDRDNLRNARDLAAVLARHRQVRRVVCGHVHRAVIGSVGDVPVVIAPSSCHQVALDLGDDAAGAFGLEPPGFALHRWTEADGFSSHIAYVGPFPGPFPFTG